MSADTRRGVACKSRYLAAIAVLAYCCSIGTAVAVPPPEMSERLTDPVPQSGSERPPSSTGTRRALLIGVGKHLFNDEDFDGRRRKGKDPTFPKDLRGAVNDVRLLESVLVQRYDFPPESIVTLTDAEATREAILAAMSKIVEQSGPDDVVHIHFSGHGSYTKDLSGEERDKYDETILPYDARTGEVPDITDDEINAILSGLKTRAALVTFDSCHSGTATRGQSDIVSRGGGPDPMAELYGQVATRGQGIGNKVRVDATETILPASENYVYMAGAAAEHRALDSTIDSEVFYGWFSWSLAQALSKVDQNQPASSVWFEIRANMKSISEKKDHRVVPEPMFEATDADRVRPLLAGGDLVDETASITRRTWVRADPAGEGKILLQQGRLFGALEESLWAIYPPGTTDFIDTPQVGTAIVKSLSGGDSVANLRSAGSIEPESRAVLIAPSWTLFLVRVHLDKMSDADKKGFRKALEAEESSADRFKLVDAGERARFVVDIADRTVRIFTTGRLREVESFPFEDMDAAVARAVRVFERPVEVADILNMDNPSSEIALEFSVRTPDEDGTPRVRTVPGSGSLPAYHLWHEGGVNTESNSLTMEVSADRDVYLTIVQLDPTGTLSILFPNRTTPDPKGRIPGGQRIRIPDSAPNEIQSQVYYFDVFPPVGKYELRAFAATDLSNAIKIWDFIGEYGIALQELEDDPLYVQEKRRQAGLATGGDRLVSRGSTVEPDWTAVTASFLVEDQDDR